MTPLPSPHDRRVLIVEDEFLIALDLEETMFELGFDVSALAPSASKARSLAMSDQPDVALVDVCLEGGREGIVPKATKRKTTQASPQSLESHAQTAKKSAGKESRPLQPIAFNNRKAARRSRVIRDNSMHGTILSRWDQTARRCQSS
jgi:two-component system, response regulator PdtaR